MKAGDKVFVSKYAFSGGITEETLRLINDDGIYCWTEERKWKIFKMGRDIHPTKAEAVKAALRLRDKKLTSLRAQIVKLEKMTF